MIRKRAVWCTGSGTNIADARSLITGLKHDLQAGVEDLFAKGRFGHKAQNTHGRIVSAKKNVLPCWGERLQINLAPIAERRLEEVSVSGGGDRAALPT
jgi:hypothetical protein